MKEIFSWWFFPFCKLTGVLPVFVKDGALQFSWFTAIRNVLILVPCLVWIVTKGELYNSATLGINAKCTLVILWSCVLSTIVITLVTTLKCKMNAFDRLAKKLVTFDRFWKEKGAIEPRHENYVSIYFVALQFGGKILQVILYNYTSTVSMQRSLTGLALVPIVCVNFIFIIIESEILSTICKNFRKLNKIVKYCFKQRSEMILYAPVDTKNVSKDAPNVTVEEIRDMHVLLCTTVEEVNSFFGVQNIFYFLSLLLTVVIRPFYFTNELLNPTKTGSTQILFLYNQSSEFILTGLQLFIISYLGSATARKAKRTAYHVSRYLSLQLSQDERKEVKEALLHICDNKAQLRVFNLFNVELSLVSSTVGVSIGIVVLQLS